MSLFDFQDSVIVSRCWTGEICRYDCKPAGRPALIARIRRRFNPIFVCPEVLGGLPVPRPAAPLHRKHGQIIHDITGRNCSIEFIAGAQKTLEIALAHNCKIAYLVRGSPSCDARGFTGELLLAHGIRIINY